MYSFKHCNQNNFIPIFLALISLLVVDIDATSSYELLSKSAFNKKFQRIVNKIHPNQSQYEELLQIFSFIEGNFETWMDSQDPRGFFQIKITDETYLSIHPEAKDILIFLKGHYTFIAQGCNKKVIKGISFREEKEVAVCYAKSIGFDLNQLDHRNYKMEPTLEGQVLESIQGLPSVLSVYYITYPLGDKRDGFPVIVAEYYNGGTLELLNVGQVSLEQRLLVIHDALQGLKEIHKRNVIHADLLAKNIIFEKSLQTGAIEGAYLIDFGKSYFCNGDECISKFQDVNELVDVFEEYFSSNVQEKNCNHIVKDLRIFLKNVSSHNISAKKAYSEFVNFLSWHYEDEIKHEIMKNAK